MATAQVLHMKGGAGETSYAKNSLLQRKIMLKTKPVLEESIKRLLYSSSFVKCLKVADLGCSLGPNALLVISEIINIVDTTSRSLNCEPPSFQFFLSDLFGNDFNTICVSLPDFYKRLEQEKGRRFGTCFISATPGTFYERLFPSNSFHFFHSSYSLHWLSLVPEGLTKGEEPLNKDNIYRTHTDPPAVYKAYVEQFQQDFILFLRLLSEELVAGGSMLLTPTRQRWLL